MSRKLAYTLSTLALSQAPMMDAAAKQVAGVDFEGDITLGQNHLSLSGAGLRTKFVINMYAVGLYLPGKTTDARQAIVEAGPKRLRVVGLHSVNMNLFLMGFNGKPMGQPVPGEDLYQALLRVWLGDTPAQDDLKMALTGH